jgi:uncharacterized protein (UPF0248 family)
MIPIHEILNRIRWDSRFADAEFEIGYLDRVRHRIRRIALKEIAFDKENRYFFELLDEHGELHEVPLHRIKALWRNGELIWHREH